MHTGTRPEERVPSSASDVIARRGCHERLRREAQALARLSHPNLVCVHDFGAVDHGYYIVMELVEGERIDQHLHKRAASWQEIVACFVQAGLGLAAAHAEGIVHRIPTTAREVYDVVGAGDTVTAYLATALAAGASAFEAAVVANFAAGVEVGKLGAATVTPAEIIEAYDVHHEGT